MALSPRSIIHEHQFNDELRGLISDEILADMFIEAAEFVLANTPEIGLPIADGSHIYALPMAPVGRNQVTIFYRFDGSTVWMLSIRAF